MYNIYCIYSLIIVRADCVCTDEDDDDGVTIYTSTYIAYIYIDMVVRACWVDRGENGSRERVVVRKTL